MSAPVSITLSRLGFATADGTPLFTDLSLSFGPGCTGLVGRNGCGKTTLLRLIAGDLVPRAGAVTRQGGVALLRQRAAPAPGETVADLFDARAGLALLARAEAGHARPDELAAADWTLPARIAAALARLGLDCAPETPLEALSGGQVARASLAALIVDAPEFLLLDEPTNDLDAAGREAVHALLAGWRGGALVASHDRALLERMDAIVELSPLGAVRHGGGFSDWQAQKAVALAAAEADLAQADRDEAEARRRAQEAAERKARKDGAGRRERARGGQAKILLDAQKARSEASGGAGRRLREARLAAAQEQAVAARARLERIEPLRMEMPALALPEGRVVLGFERVSGGYDPARPVLRGVSFAVTGPERLAVTGPNGAGKSTLLALAAGRLEPLVGRIARPVAGALLDQRLSLLDPGETLLANFLRLNPQARAEEGRAALARFRFRARAALQPAGALSGGQRLRAALACVLGGPRVPGLLMLDEPTNHLDLDGMGALEAALRGYGGALMVVSHDAAFLGALGIGRRIAL